jgi:rhodanese-related sulfurtransferase
LRKCRAIGLCIMVMLALSACDPDGINNLTAEELKKMIDSNETLLVVDTRTEFEFMRGHIPRAILITQEKAGFVQRFLPDDKNLPLVFYCTGVG